MKKNILFALLCMLPLLIGCSSSDDVSDIFVGKTWRFNYIAKGGKNTTWYNFADVTQDNIQQYTNRTKTFTVSFSGLQSGDLISGTFSGSGSLSAGGKWSANGHSGTFTTSEVWGDPNDTNDMVAQKIVYGLTNAKSYAGDTNGNLFIYFDYEGTTLLMGLSQYTSNN